VSELDDFAEVMRLLRAQCPWKREQTHRSLARYLLEETHETLEVLDAADDPGGPDDDHLREELGDLLLQVFFHAAIAEERGAFTLDDVARGVADKMRRRNPHVFGGLPDPGGAAAVDDAWQQIKAAEGPAGDLPPSLPGLLMAAKTLQRRARAGEALEVRPTDPDLGERLLALVAEAVEEDVDPEQALRDAVRRRT
jgi:XTP/dITP diphosphohydrolase